MELISIPWYIALIQWLVLLVPISGALYYFIRSKERLTKVECLFFCLFYLSSTLALIVGSGGPRLSLSAAIIIGLCLIAACSLLVIGLIEIEKAKARLR